MPSQRLTIAAIYAHPDDGEFFAAGTLAKWAEQGHKVYAICATAGDLGTKQRGASRTAIAEQRAAELGEAMKALGGEPPIMLGYPDGFLRDHAAALKERLVYHLRRLRVDRVLTFDPWKKYEIHPDHIEAGRMASEAACFACFPLLYPEHLDEGLDPVQPKELFYMMPTEHRPNRLVDIGKTFDQKVRSLLCHSSQIEMLADWFVPGADPTKLSPDERAALEGGARGFLDMMARGMAQISPHKVERCEAFYALKVGPGHFDNYQEMFMEAAGAPPQDPEIG
ncbi:MAG: PIG-L deacetylase family protein [Byssovorax sp.]